MAKSQFLADTLKTFLFSLSQGMAASSGARGRQGTNLGMAAALGAPMQLGEMERQRQMQEEDRQQRIEAARAATRRGEIDEAVKILNALQGSVAPEVQVNAPVATPSPIGTMDGGTFQPPSQGGGTMGVPTPLKPVEIPGYGMAQPQSAQQMAVQKANELRQQAQLEQEMAPPPGYDPFNTPGGTINKNNPGGGFLPGTAPTPEPGVAPELVEAIVASPERIHDLPPTLVAALLPELHKRNIEIPPKPVDPTLQGIRDLQFQNLKREGMGELTSRQIGIALQLSSSVKAHPAYVDMLDIQTGMEGVETGLAQDNGFGDITAINSFQRMVDPGATVREGDVSLMQSASAFVDRVLSDFPIERLRSGAKLPDATRKAMLKTAKELYARRAKNYNDTVGTQFKSLAKASQIPFEFVGRDFSTGESTTPDTPAGRIRVRNKATGQTGTISEGAFDAAKYEKL